ncbi:MAG: GIY-YIG nuclease family protein [Bacteroidota bacterium]
MKRYYVYILECSYELLYTGITNNIERRLTEHNSGLNKRSFTHKRRPVTLKFHQEFIDVNQAIYFEKKIKRWSAQKKRALIEKDFDLLKILAECRNVSNHKHKSEDE